MREKLAISIACILSFIFVLGFAACGTLPDDGGSVDNSEEELQTVYYDVEFDGGGVVSVDSQVVKQGEKAKKPQDPADTILNNVSYKFRGWYLGDTEFDFESEITADIIIVARWDTETYSPDDGGSVDNSEEELQTVYYDVEFDGGGVVSVDSQKVKQGEKAKKPQDPADTILNNVSYKFRGWYLGDTEFDFESEITADIIIVARWDTETYSPDDGGSVDNSEEELQTVYYDVVFDGGGVVSVDSQKVKQGEKAKKPQDPADTILNNVSYKFRGWYLGDTEFDFESEITANIIIVARWDTEKYSGDLLIR